ncbi:MAG: ABC transporter ATP-binding protein [Eubacterium sp.]|nr:ABC transporter ATP-binding protein [Eubacterium sp.]
MNVKSIIEIKDLVKKYNKGFVLGEINLDIPKGFSTALIGANGAGKTTLMDVLCGICEKTSGEIKYFGQTDNIDYGNIKERIGYCAASSYFPMDWKVKDVKRSMSAAFKGFSEERFDRLLEEFDIKSSFTKTIAKLSDGNKMRLYLAAVLARETELLVLDEPGSALDPLMRDRLCDRFRDYLDKGDGKNSIIFSTHNIADMENAADYAVIMSKGKIIEKGFIEDLKAKYISFSADASAAERLRGYAVTLTKGSVNANGLALAEYAGKFTDAGAAIETPDLQRLSVELLRAEEDNHART